MDDAFQFIIDNNGIDTEEDYPYRGVDSTCNKKKVFTFTLHVNFIVDWTLSSNVLHSLVNLAFFFSIMFCFLMPLI